MTFAQFDGRYNISITALMLSVYGKNLGTEHKCTKVAGFHYVKIRKRVAMYNHICGGSTINEDLSSFYK